MMTYPLPSHDTLMVPFSQEAEEAVIGSVLISAAAVLPQLLGTLRAEHFFLIRNRLLWQSFERLSARNDILDLTTISEDLRQHDTLEDIGGYAYLIHLISNTPNSMHAEAYASLVERTATRRRLLSAADEIRTLAYDETLNVDQVMTSAEQLLNAVENDYAILPEPISMIDAIQQRVEKFKGSVKRYKANPNYVIGVRTGLSDLDVMLDGLRPGITTLAGATGVGKSALMMTIAQFAAQRGLLREDERPAKTLLFSGEMTLDQLLSRLLATKTGIPVRDIERGSTTGDQVLLLNKACNELMEDHDLTFESMKRLNTTQIRQRVRRMVANQELDLLVLDGLLQIDDFQGDTGRGKRYADAKRRDAIESIMNDLEDIGLTYDLPILLTHQISRAPATRQNKRPQLSDLAEASFVEQKSAVILFLYREGYYEPACMDPNGAEIIVAKNRHGETGTINAYYDRQYTRFLNADRVSWTLGV